MNSLVTGYSIALAKTLGSGAGAMTQILLSEVGEVLSAMVDEILGSKQVSYELENVEELLKNAFLELGIAENVKIEKDVKELNLNCYYIEQLEKAYKINDSENCYKLLDTKKILHHIALGKELEKKWGELEIRAEKSREKLAEYKKQKRLKAKVDKTKQIMQEDENNR